MTIFYFILPEDKCIHHCNAQQCHSKWNYKWNDLSPPRCWMQFAEKTEIIMHSYLQTTPHWCKSPVLDHLCRWGLTETNSQCTWMWNTSLLMISVWRWQRTMLRSRASMEKDRWGHGSFGHDREVFNKALTMKSIEPFTCSHRLLCWFFF